MILNLPRRGWPWHRLKEKAPLTLCLQCRIRRQHSAAVESLRDTREENVEPQGENQSHQGRPRGAHPPRAPRRYIEERRKDIPLKSFQFMKQEPRPRPTAPPRTQPFPRGRTPNTTLKFESQIRDQGLEKDIDLVASVTSLSLKMTYM